MSSYGGTPSKGRGRGSWRPHPPPAAEVRRRAVRRALLVGEGRPAAELPLLLAAAAVLYGPEGRADFRESELLAVAAELRAELRGGFGFTADEEAAGARAYEAALEQLHARLPASAVESWLRPCRGVGLRGGELWVSAPERCADWLERRYAEAIAAAAGVERVSTIRAEGAHLDTEQPDQRRSR